MTRRKFVFLPVFILPVVLAGWLGGATVVRADHNDNEFGIGPICYSCHVLNALLADPDPNTSFITKHTRTYDTMLSLNNGSTPDRFGCTFCHNDPVRTTYMKTAIGPFDGRPSQHPLDRGYSKDNNSNITLTANTYTTMYMSNWDNSWGRPDGQIDCVGCHEMTGAYPNHPRPDNVVRVNNPFMLRGGNASWNTADNSATNAFCLGVCHAGTAQGTSGWKAGHYGWGAYDNTTGGMADNTLKELDGTALKTSRCTACHETHSASVKPNLMGEQRQSLWMIGNTNSYYNPVLCTQCHPGDAAGDPYKQRGHGKTPINLSCSQCHEPAVSHREMGNPKRFTPGAESAILASLKQNLWGNGVDDNYNGAIDDDAEMELQFSSESICGTCHADMHIHNGEIGGASGSASCLHCHDPHGKGVDTNIKMIRRTVMGRTTNYLTSRTDLFRTDNTSICDNPSCHPKSLGSPSQPGTILGDVQEHKDANVVAGTDCIGCHSHSSSSGGSSFAPVCNSCHTYPGQPVLANTHVLGGMHGRHAGLDNTGGYGFACSVCHYRYTHNQSNVNTGLEWDSKVQDNNVNIRFDGIWTPPGAGVTYAGVAADNNQASAAGGIGGTGTCAGLYCHGNLAAGSSWTAGSDTTPEWNNAATGVCGTCHPATAVNPPQTFAHRKHADNTSVGYGISCRKCHYLTTSDGLTITNRSAHVNRQSQVSFDTTDTRLSSGSYSGTATVGDSGTTAGACSNIYCHSPGNKVAAPFDVGPFGAPDWKDNGALVCNSCHGAQGQTGIAVGMPGYENGSPKINSHEKHLGDRFACRVCHWATTTSDNTIANRAKHANGERDAVSEGNLTANPAADFRQRSHDFAYDNGTQTCNTAACHGGTAPVWGAAGPISCDACHKNTAGAPATADADDFSWDNGVMTKVRDSEWTTTGHGRTTGSYASGRNAADFTSCTTRCHSTGVSHNTSNNPFRLIDNAANTDFNDISDPRSFKDNKVCLDCHSATGATKTAATVYVEENHFGTGHDAQTDGGSFCWDCHDPHGDPNDYMIHDNVTMLSDGQYGVPDNAAGSRKVVAFRYDVPGGDNNAGFDWADYVKSSSPYTGICQACHTTTDVFKSTTWTATDAEHNKIGTPGAKCTTCHLHTADFASSCNSCHGSPDLATGPPPYGPSVAKAGLNQLWNPSVDNISNLAGVGNHRSWAGLIDNSSHDPWMGTTAACSQCHTGTPGSGSHNIPGALNAYMDNLASHDWYNGAPASWDNGGTSGTTNVVDDSCSNIDCHSPYYGSTANQYRSGTPMPYKRYWVNKTLWDCYTCHAYDGRTGVGSRPRPGGADNTMASGAHGKHVGANQIACASCHNVTGYAAAAVPAFGFGATAHKNGVVDWSFAGAPNPPGYPAPPSDAYNVASGSRAPTDDNTAAGHVGWGSCSNVYCHSSVQKNNPDGLPGGVAYATASWDNQTTGQCGTCHAGDGVSGNLTKMTSGSHAQHLASGYAMSCDACHTGSGTGHATHADGIIQVPMGDNAWRVFALTAASTRFDRATAPGVDNANKTPGAAYGRCSNIACHTNGAAGAPRIDNAVWGDAQTAATNCTYCHGGNTASGASMATNAHGKHIATGYLCSSCHADTAAAGTDNVLNAAVGKGAALHVDNQVQVVNGNGYTFGWNGGTKDCSNISCHGGNAANWVSGVGQLQCGSCHLAAAADSDQYQSAGDTWFNNDNIATLNTTEWGYSGHGKTSLSYDVSGHPAANFPGGAGAGDPCRYCHDPNSTHRQASNPFRLIRQDNVAKYATAGWNATCLVCHSNAPLPDGYGTVYGYASRIGDVNDRVDTAHYGTKHNPADNTSGGRFCWDCHDAHGDRANSTTGNIYMIQSAALAKSDGVYGYRGTAGEVTAAVTFKLDNTVNLGGDWARSDYRGVCQVCHHGNGTGSSTEAKYYTPSAFQNHNKDKVCTSCHEHDKNFGASCNACHGEATGVGVNGMPPYAPSAGNNPWPSRTSVDNVSVAAGIGNHRPVPAAGIDNSSHAAFECTECHTSTPGSGGTHDNASNQNATMTNLLARKWTDGTTATTWTANTVGRTGSVVDDSCNNVDCHSPYYSGNAAKSGTPFPYGRYWENQTRWDCYTCHGYTAAVDNTNTVPPNLKRAVTTGSHTAHVDYQNRSFPCAACHNVAGYSASTWPNSATHKDGLVQVPITGTLGAVTLAGNYTANNLSPTDNVSRAWGTCQTVYCHSTVQTSPPSGSSRTYLETPQWGAGIASIVCGSCHKGAGNDHNNNGTWMDTGSHTVHAQTKQYRCTNCHQYPGQPSATPNHRQCYGCHNMDGVESRHVDGYINVRFGDTIDPDNVFILSGIFDNNGDHVNDNTIVPGAPYGTCESLYCHGTGTPLVTGGANQFAGTPNIPKWGDVNTSKCGSCHGGPGGTTNYVGKASNYPTSGAHAIHLDNTSMAGPRITSCTDCHTANSAATHVDGRVDFRTSYLDNSATSLDNTSTCDPCHALGASAAKANWASVGALDCLTCHGATPAYTYANAVGRVAPNEAGDNATYGAAVRGHNRPTALGNYPATNNPAANRTCAECHDLTIPHIDGTDNTTYTGNRLLATVNGTPTTGTVRGLCQACHTTTGGSPVALQKNKGINTHGNTDFGTRREETFALDCGQCHEPHGMVNVASEGVNIWMINPTIRVTGSVSYGPVRLFQKSGPNSFNVYDPGTGNDNNASLYYSNARGELCVVCHADTNSPGFQTRYNVAGRHNAPGYTGNEAGKDCSGCHSHNRDGNIATVDGLMPAACNACHSYPGIAGGTWTQAMSQVHAKHVGTPTDTTNTKGYECTACHFNNVHNDNNVVAGAGWPSNYYTFVDVRFDPALNPVNGNPQRYAGALADGGQATPARGVGSPWANAACDGLYCHGNSSTQSTWGGNTVATPPQWDNTPTASCGTCHRADASMPQGNHPVHLSAAYGPGYAAFTSDGTCSEGAGCHTRYGLSPTTSHVDGLVSLRFTPVDNTAVALGATQICQNCHSAYASTAGTGDTLVRTPANWNDNLFIVPCITCHNASAGQQGTQYLGGGGDKATNIEATYYGSGPSYRGGHGDNLIDNTSTPTDAAMVDQVPPVRCGTCHDHLALHIGSAKDGTNPWRLNGVMTNYTQTGGLDQYCLGQCHSLSAVPPRHAWRVNGSAGAPAQTKDNNVHTHPTTVEAVPSGKDRWIRVTVDNTMPVAADLLSNSPPARSSASMLVCVTCHDPHGVGTAAVPGRSFSGANDNGFKMLRFKSGSLNVLCTKCHK